jgi:hypothetical protein
MFIALTENGTIVLQPKSQFIKQLKGIKTTAHERKKFSVDLRKDLIM